MGNRFFFRFFFYFIATLLVATLLTACYNYFFVNNNIQTIIKDTELEIIQTDSIARSLVTSVGEQKDIINCQKETFKHIYDKYSRKMGELNKRVFDSNVLTFMISFLLVSLVSILFNIEIRALNHIQKAEDTMRQFDSMLLYTRIHILLTIFYGEKDYHRLAKEAESMLDDFNKYEYITKKWKTNFEDIICNKMLFELNIDQNTLDDDEYRKDCIEALKKLLKEISRLREV